MRLRMVILALLGVLLLGLVGLVAALATLDFGRFKGPIAAQVERATGRAMIFDGEVSLRLFPRPSLQLRDVALANAAWGSRPHMLRVGTLSAEVELRPLLFERALHVTRLVMRDADLLLETDAEGRRNWELGATTAEPAPPGGVRTDAAGLPLIDEMQLANIAISWRDARNPDGAGSVLLRELKLSSRPDGRLALAGAAVFRAQDLAFAGDFDLPTGFQAPGGPFVANLNLTLPGTVVKLAGGLADARAGRGLDLSLSAEAEPLASLDDFADLRLPAVKAHLSARIQGDLGGTLRLSELVVRLGRTDLAGSAALDLSGKRPRVVAELESTRLDLAEALPPAKPAEPAGGDAAPKHDGRLFSAEPFDFAALRRADADLTLRAALVEAPSLRVERVLLRLVLADGDLAVRPYEFTILGSQIAGDARLNSAANPPALVLDAAGQQMDLGRLMALAGHAGILEARGDLVLALRGAGNSPRALAAALDGQASLVAGQGMLSSSYIDRLGLAGLRTALPQVQRLAETRLNCAIARFDIARGVATAKLLAADAGDLSMVGTGTINLGAETLALDLQPRIKVGNLGGVVVPVQVRGTLLEPAVAVQTRAAARGALAGLGGLVLDPGASRTNPCGGLAEVPARPAPDPTPAPATPGLPGILRLLPR